MVLALLLGVAAWFVAGDISLGVRVACGIALVVVLAIAFLTAGDLVRLGSPSRRVGAFRWAPFVLADFTLSALLLAGAGWWLYEEGRGPALAEGMWWTTDCCNVNSAYDARLRDAFPVGTSEVDLRSALARDGFDPEGHRKAVARWSDLACAHFANVEWSADADGRLTEIKGDVGSSCL